MKLYKSLLLGLLMCGFSACDTTDLERDINSLKDRVEDYEAQVQKLNDDMNIIRVLLDGNKTITSYSFDGTNYTLTLSNGETLTLTQGVVGANYPSITIDEESGNWIIAGKDSGVKAEAEDGKDAPYTPQFKIENENWWVSYDGGVTWTDLGEKATGDPSGESSLISNVTLASDGNSITIKLSDNKSYTIPVVKDLVCEITEPKLADGEMWYIACDATERLNVNVNIQAGDIIRPVVPADWNAKITTDYSNLSGIQTLVVELTAPATASKCVVTMEVNRGANTITDEIVARTEPTSYYEDYKAGLDIRIGGLVINKNNTPNGSIHSSGAVPSSGLFFVSNGNDIILKGSVKNLILLPEKYNEMPVVKAERISLDGNFACYGLNLDAVSYSDYLIANSTNSLDYVIIQDCKIMPPAQKAVAYCSKVQSIEKFYFMNNFVYFETEGQNIFNLSGISSANVYFVNNIIASKVETKGQILTLATTNPATILFNNNTFYNYLPTSKGVTAKFSKETEIHYNIFYNNVSTTGTYLLQDAAVPVEITQESYANNVSYNADGKNLSWRYFNKESKLPEGATKDDLIPSATECPIIIPDDISTGGFTSSGAYAAYGAQR